MLITQPARRASNQAARSHQAGTPTDTDDIPNGLFVAGTVGVEVRFDLLDLIEASGGVVASVLGAE